MNIHKTYLLPFPVPDVFEAWVSSDTIIAPADRMHVDAVPGGVYAVIMDGPAGGSRTSGRFHAVQKDQRAVYTWEWNGDGEVTVIDVRFSAHPEGTSIELLHCGFQKPQSRTMHDAGWDSYIAGLTAHIRANGR